MCEMIKYKGNTIKIGTCENLYYATYADLKDNADYLEQVGGNAAVEDYLNEKYGFRYRFPFADEKPSIGCYTLYERGFLVKIPRARLKNPAIQIYHNRTFTRNENVPGFAYGFYTPCPTQQSDEIELMDWSNLRDHLIFELFQQKQVGGHLETIVRCPFCNNLSRFGVDEWTEINAIIQDPANDYTELTRENSARAMAGYLTKL